VYQYIYVQHGDNPWIRHESTAARLSPSHNLHSQANGLSDVAITEPRTAENGLICAYLRNKFHRFTCSNFQEYFSVSRVQLKKEKVGKSEEQLICDVIKNCHSTF
jgi:hypothetical protein